jgi:hypothetical protein
MRLVSLALLAVLLPTAAAAQNRGVFVEGGALFGVRFTPSAEGDPTLFSLSASPTYEWNDLNGDRRWQPGEEGALLPSTLLRQTSNGRVAPGASAAVGVFVAPSVSLRLEGSFHGDYVTTLESNGFLSSLTARQTETVTDFTVAAGWHQGESRRTTIGYLGGIVFRRQRDETVLASELLTRNTISPTGSSFTTLPGGFALEQTFESTSYSTGVIVGVDVAIKVTSHLAVVPQVRMVAFDQDWRIRPVVTMRWRP